jgi:hypothetical protein
LLDEDDAGAKDFGKDLSADANIAITDDVINIVRPQGSGYDIGASEVQASSAPHRSRIIQVGARLGGEIFLAAFVMILALVLHYKKR